MRRFSFGLVIALAASVVPVPVFSQTDAREEVRRRAREARERLQQEQEAERRRREREEAAAREDERRAAADAGSATTAPADAGGSAPPADAGSTSAPPPADAGSSASPASTDASTATPGTTKATTPAPSPEAATDDAALIELRKTRDQRQKASVEALEKRWGPLLQKDEALAELEVHAKRVAYLQRIRGLAVEKRDQAVIKKVDELVTLEDIRHSDAMNALRN